MADRAARGQAHLWVVQRITAMILALAVLVHLATIITAVRGGLSAREILARTQGFRGLADLLCDVCPGGRAAWRDWAPQHRR
jgi:succinate dehydrogenase hydrophobic anchor subunit